MATTDIFYGDRLHQQSVDRRVGSDERFHSALLESVGQAIVAVDLNRTIIFWNRAAEEMFGWSAEEAVGKQSTDVLVRGESTRRTGEIFDAMARGHGWTGEMQVERRDGTQLWVLVTNRPVFDAEGGLIAVVGSSIDVSERKAEETARQQLAAIVASSADAIFGVTVDGRITSWNRAAETLLVTPPTRLSVRRLESSPPTKCVTNKNTCGLGSGTEASLRSSRRHEFARTARLSTCC